MPAIDKETGLTDKQEAFCIELVKARNGKVADAYRKAFNRTTSSTKTVGEDAQRLLRMPKIRARIADLRANAVRKTEITIDRVLDEVRCIAFVNPASVYDASGNLLPIKDIPEDTWRAIKSVEVLKNGTTLVKFFDKVQALERLMRFLGMFGKDNAQQRHSVLDDVPRHVLKEIEEFLIEFTRERGVELPAAGGGGAGH